VKKFQTICKSGSVIALSLIISHAVLASDTYKIGVLLPMSGSGASYGVPASKGVELAVQEINAAGGVNGKQLEFILRDTQLKPAVAVAAAKELITKDNVDVLMGAVSSGATGALSELALQEKKVLLAPISKAISLTRENLHKYIFQSSAHTDVEGRTVASIVNKVGGKNVCVTGFDYAYSHDLFDSVAQNLKDGAKVSATYNVKLGSKDFNALISQLMGDSCDTVVGAIWGGGFIAFVNQATPFGLFNQKKFIWAAEVGSYETASALGKNYPEGMWANSYNVWYHNISEEHKKFQDDLAKFIGEKETPMYPISTYVGVKFLAAGIAKAGSADGDKLSAAMEGLSIDAPMGKQTIDPKTHRVNMGEFWGPMKAIEGSEVKRMSPPTYMD
jgi:branched-chain amino acid transport system substrate-binding protein